MAECAYVAAKGMHLYVLHVFEGRRGEVCHGCGRPR